MIIKISQRDIRLAVSSEVFSVRLVTHTWDKNTFVLVANLLLSHVSLRIQTSYKLFLIFNFNFLNYYKLNYLFTYLDIK